MGCEKLPQLHGQMRRGIKYFSSEPAGAHGSENAFNVVLCSWFMNDLQRGKRAKTTDEDAALPHFYNLHSLVKEAKTWADQIGFIGPCNAKLWTFK